MPRRVIPSLLSSVALAVSGILAVSCASSAPEVVPVVQVVVPTGTAVVEPPPVQGTLQCGSSRCGPKAPVCCISKEGVRSCGTVATCETVPDTLTMKCFSNADCPGGGQCCGFPFSGMVCRPYCDGIAALRMCQSDADCTVWNDWPIEGFGPPTHCIPIDGLVLGMRACSTAEE